MKLIADFLQARALSSRPPHSVSFADLPEVAFFEKYSDEYKTDLWFSIDEIATFTRHTMAMLRAIHSSNLTVAQFVEMSVRDMSSFTGLENFLVRTTAGRVTRARRTLWRMVLGAQGRQRRLGTLDHEELAMISEAASKWSRERARIIGLIHAEN